MFLKIFRHEFKKLFSVTFILFGAQLLLGLFVGVSVRIMTEMESALNVFIASSLSGVMMFSILAMGVVCAAISILIVYRFYRSISSDEAYLTFSLPATTKEQLGARFLVMYLYNLISYVVLILAIGICVLTAVSFPQISEMLSSVMENLRELFLQLDVSAVLYSVEGIFALLVFSLLSVSETMFAVILAHVAAKKHKAGATVGMLIALGYAEGILFEIVTLPVTLALAVSGRYTLQVSYFLTMILAIAFLVVCSVVSYRLIDRKLNLD